MSLPIGVVSSGLFVGVCDLGKGLNEWYVYGHNRINE